MSVKGGYFSRNKMVERERHKIRKQIDELMERGFTKEGAGKALQNIKCSMADIKNGQRERIMEGKYYTMETLDKVIDNLEKHGAKCHLYVNALVTADSVLYELDHIRVYFKSKRWDIVDIEVKQ